MRVVALLSTLAASLAAQQAGVQGIVVDQTTGKPLERVHITLQPEDRLVPDRLYGAMSDAAGHFSIATVNPGRYLVSAGRTGYSQVASKGADGAPSVSLKAGQPVSDLKVEMARNAMIAGRVTDQYGDPVAHLTVYLAPALPEPSMMALRENGQTDERGQFRILSGPGKYYLQVVFNGTPTQGMPEVRSDGTSELIYTSTYYPSSATKDRASMVEVEAGRDVEGLEIRLAPAASQRFFSISGALTNLPKDSQAVVIAVPVDGKQGMPSQQAETREDGKFTLQGLTSGTYDLRVFAGGDMHGGTRVKVENADAINVVVALGPAADLTGTVEITGAPAAKRTVRLEPTGHGPFGFINIGFGLNGGDQLSGDVEPDGAFRIPNIVPGRYRAVVSPLPDAAYIKTLASDGVAVPDGVIDLDGGARSPHLKISVALDGAIVSGRVLDKDGELAAKAGTDLFLMAGPKQVEDAYQTLLEEGRFTLKGVRPGKYRLVFISLAQFFSDPDADAAARLEIVSKQFATAEEIEIHAGDRIDKEFKLDAGKQ